MLLVVIAACEIGFWVLLAAGMITRYGFRLPRLGMALLLAVPLVDVVMLVASVIDIRQGGEPSFKHSLAAIFIGVSVGFGHQTLPVDSPVTDDRHGVGNPANTRDVNPFLAVHADVQQQVLGSGGPRRRCSDRHRNRRGPQLVVIPGPAALLEDVPVQIHGHTLGVSEQKRVGQTHPHGRQR